MSAPRKSLLRKRASRLAAAQALYARALKEDKGAPSRVVTQALAIWADSKTYDAHDLPFEAQPEQALLTTIVTTAIEKRARIEAAIEGLILPNWKKSRMSLPLLCVMRAAAAEALAASRPRGLLVEEYTEVAAQLVGDEEIPYAHKAFNLLFDALLADTPAQPDEQHG